MACIQVRALPPVRRYCLLSDSTSTSGVKVHVQGKCKINGRRFGVSDGHGQTQVDSNSVSSSAGSNLLDTLKKCECVCLSETEITRKKVLTHDMENWQVCGCQFESYLAQFHSRSGDALLGAALNTWLINKLAGGPSNLNNSEFFTVTLLC